MTRQRRVILEELRKVRSHPTADEIYQMARKHLPRISLGTVYRNLEVLSDQGLIKKLDVSGDRSRFDGDLTEHVHIRCIVCGRVDDFPVRPAVTLPEINNDCGYEIGGFVLEFSGQCPQCKKAEVC
ncbi:transcriptional repressor [candidate division LCP-89 bacterium B3_LCP]|uniref:Transcriptional repressor n=1 Tax=candidate division LCP-89 bacterium B3_LCP TaxID=2012998 RepID=A0A532V5A0_UNCL8|nr:MAG: transcriptional repressor [candidate division LCP-89 bacterium B3_LCP]